MMSNPNKKLWACAALAFAAMLVGSTHANAVIMWVEVDGALTDGSTPDNDNTTVDTGSIEVGFGGGSSDDGTDDNWDEWPGGSNPATSPQVGSIALIARGSENAGVLTSSLDLELDTGVPYNLFALFRSSEFTQGAITDQEGIEVKLSTDANFQSFDQNSPDAVQFGTSTFYYAPFATVIGQTGTDTIDVNVRQFFTDIEGQFTVFDAIGYEAVVPEPASLALLGLGGAVMLSGRRRRS